MWFTDGIVNALNKSKAQQLALLVYLEGNNDTSSKMTEQLESNDTIRNVVNKKTIALKLIENSKEAAMFNQIYPAKPSPAIYVVSHNGQLLETFTSDTFTEDALIKLLNDKVHSNELPSSSSTSTPNTTPSVVDNRSIDEKRKELIERIKQKNEKEDEIRSKNREMERIKSGRMLNKLRKEQEQREAEELIKQREKDAAFDKLERERVLRAIEEDNQEKKARFELERIKREEEFEKYQQQRNENNSSLKCRTIELSEGEIKIQFKLPNGELLISKFKSNEPLQVAFDHLKENSDFTDFHFALAYPKRKFDSNNSTSSFEELGIKNSAVLLVIENESHATSSRKSNASTIAANYPIVEQIRTLILSIFTFIDTLLSDLLTSLVGRSGSTRVDGNSSSLDRNQGPPPSGSRDRGFRSKFDQDDNNRTNTYNGNNTEQQ